MKPTTHRSHVLAGLAVLPAVLEDDEQRAMTERRRRDRAIGKRLSQLAQRPVAQVLAWLVSVGSEQRLERARAALHAVLAVLIAAGLVFGCAAAVGAFFYDGTTRVNVVAVLALFVGLQTVLLAFALLSMLPEHVLRWLPGAEPAAAILRMLSPGRLVLLAQKLLPKELKQTLLSLTRPSDSPVPAPRLRVWMVVVSSQYLALAFNTGAVLSALCLVVFSDIAFGWATTLDVGAAGFHRLIEWLALPWAWWLPNALPSIELIEASRYYRLEDAAQRVEDPKLLGQWWPFVIASMVTYGLLPRLLLLGFALYRLGRAGEQALGTYPGVQALVERLNTTLIETQAEEPEASADVDRSPRPPGPLRHALPNDVCAIIDWADVPDAERWVRHAFEGRDPPGTLHRAGGGRTLETDQKVVEAIRGSQSRGSVAILTKSWEPPLLELDDFLDALRNAIGRERNIVIVPVSTPGNTLRAPDMQRWQRMVEERRDDRLQLADSAAGAVDG